MTENRPLSTVPLSDVFQDGTGCVNPVHGIDMYPIYSTVQQILNLPGSIFHPGLFHVGVSPYLSRSVPDLQAWRLHS